MYSAHLRFLSLSLSFPTAMSQETMTRPNLSCLLLVSPQLVLVSTPEMGHRTSLTPGAHSITELYSWSFLLFISRQGFTKLLALDLNSVCSAGRS